ncbi:deaminase domain-containing protein [Pseudomonas sp. NPDC089534]|uniref:deaminase domain-containing protein n=1 Tax=Pseudomonas sp. NPDC089534 TaxID=3364468 RepID=UPI0037FDE476
MTQTSEPATDTDTAEELRARQALGFDDTLNVERLIRQPNAKDRKLFRSLQRSHPVTLRALTLEDLSARSRDALIVTTVKDFMAGKPALIRHLGAEELRLASEGALRATPSAFLLRILGSAPARDLASRLLKALRWYGAVSGEQTPESLRHQLLCRAIALYSSGSSGDDPQVLAGFRWQDPARWGKSYQTLRREFEQHLRLTGRAVNTKEAVLLAHVLQTRLSRDFTVPDIPSDLRYKSSVVWVNFMHGVLLAEELNLDGAQPLSFQQLVDLPMERSMAASPEELATIARLRLAPALEWAVCNGVVRSRPAGDYDQADAGRALDALERHSKNLTDAVLTLDAPPPERMKMAKRIQDQLFGVDTFGSDGRTLLPDGPSDRYGHGLTPTLTLRGREFVDVLADGQFENGRKWHVTRSDGKTHSGQWIRIDGERILHWESWDAKRGQTAPALLLGRPNPNGKALPDINALFEERFNAYLSTARTAYRTLIVGLLASLPPGDRRLLEKAEIRVLCLRKKTPASQPLQDVQARKGFILEAILEGDAHYYEVIPSAGVVRRRTALRYVFSKGNYTEYPLRAPIPGKPFDPAAQHDLLLDWTAHLNGTAPKDVAYGTAYIDEVARLSAGQPPGPDTLDEGGIAWESPGLLALGQSIADGLLFVDGERLRTQARGVTVFDEQRAREERKWETLLALVKGWVPFWGSSEDLQSDKATDRVMGGIGLFLDLASFLFPVGKFISGSVHLARIGAKTSQMAVKASLPSFSTLSRKLLVSSLNNLNPLDGLPALFKSMASGIRLAGSRALRHLTAKNHDVSRAIDTARRKPLADGDRLATVKGTDDVWVRNTSASDPARFHLVDPLTSLPYGPRLSIYPKDFTQGLSTFPMLPPTATHALALLPEKAHVRELLETNGRTTLLIDDVPYRLDSGQLRRADLIDDRALYKSLPCRAKRSPENEVCQTVHVTREPAPTPPLGSQDESKGWAPWFGDTFYSPAVAGQPTALKTLKALETFKATAHFQKGIYARIKARVSYGRRNLFDEFKAGAILVPSKDESKRYLFTRLDAGDFYVAELSPGQSIFPSQTLRKAQTLPSDLAEELKTVYTGSLNANNMVRIHGQALVERALKTMEEIAIPIGGHANPPQTLKWLKVDTSPGEALLFDHSTRMMVSRLPAGTASWSRSKIADESFRRRAAEIFDTLFGEKTIAVKPNSDLKINKAMSKFQNLLPAEQRATNARNIAYADVETSTGVREVYVSVSGGQGLTGELPLFKSASAQEKVVIDGTAYINADFGQDVARTSLSVSGEGKVYAIPLTIRDVETYTPTMTSRPTSLDSEAKLIALLRERYPDKSMLRSVDVATTMPPCNSCSVVIKEFGHDGSADALKILWG